MIKNIRGQLLIESFVAISVAVVGLLGIMGVLSRSLSLNRVVANHYIANNLAAEGIEIIKNRIDQNVMASGSAWNAGINDGAYEVAGAPSNESVKIVFLGSKSDCGSMNSVPALKFNGATGIYNYDAGNDTVFRRCVQVLSVPDPDQAGQVDELAVIARVAWKDLGGASFDIAAEDHFFNWR